MTISLSPTQGRGIAPSVRFPLGYFFIQLDYLSQFRSSLEPSIAPRRVPPKSHFPTRSRLSSRTSSRTLRHRLRLTGRSISPKTPRILWLNLHITTTLSWKMSSSLRGACPRMMLVCDCGMCWKISWYELAVFLQILLAGTINYYISPVSTRASDCHAL